jgi:hypothetical protein
MKSLHWSLGLVCVGGCLRRAKRASATTPGAGEGGDRAGDGARARHQGRSPTEGHAAEGAALHRRRRCPCPAKAPAVAAAPLDLRTLEQRLKDTAAIGVLTKLSLKNQVDDLVARFKTYHAGARPPTLTELKPSFDLLLMKVLSLLQDKDSALARDINASRDAIWGVLTDKQKLAEFS